MEGFRRGCFDGRATIALIAACLLSVVATPAAGGHPAQAHRPESLPATAHSAAAQADYGDAPDGARAGYITAPNVVGHFPSLARSNGAHHTEATGALRLGDKFDVEADSRQVNRDVDDDGFYAQLSACHASTLTFLVNASGLPASLRGHGHTAYLNALFDWNRDGRWQGASRCAGRRIPEWLVQNRPVDMAAFAAQPIQAIQVTVPAGSQVTELWVRATLTLDQKMASAGRGAFTYGETEDYFYQGNGPVPKQKKHKKKQHRHGPKSLLVGCLGGLLPHGQSAPFPVFFIDPDTGAWVTPTPGTVSVGPLAVLPPGLVPADVDVRPFSYGYRVTSKLKDDRVNPIEPIVVSVTVSRSSSGPQLRVGPWGFGSETKQSVTLFCSVTILHSLRQGPTGGPNPGGGVGTANGSPGGGSSTAQPPTAAFTFSPNHPPTSPKAGTTVSFDGSGSTGTITAWSWTFGAPLHGGGMASMVSGGNGPSPSTSFSAPGVYPVTLTVTDNAGRTSSVTNNVFVSGPGSKLGTFSTDPMDSLGCSGMITAFTDIYIPTYSQNPLPVTGTATGGCAGATITITNVVRQHSNAPPDSMGHPRVDEWGNVKDTLHIEFTIGGGSTAQGTVPFTANWQ